VAISVTCGEIFTDDLQIYCCVSRWKSFPILSVCDEVTGTSKWQLFLMHSGWWHSYSYATSYIPPHLPWPALPLVCVVLISFDQCHSYHTLVQYSVLMSAASVCSVVVSVILISRWLVSIFVCFWLHVICLLCKYRTILYSDAIVGTRIPRVNSYTSLWA